MLHLLLAGSDHDILSHDCSKFYQNRTIFHYSYIGWMVLEGTNMEKLNFCPQANFWGSRMSAISRICKA